MDSLRKRVPFKFSSSTGEDNNSHVLDEQEQDELIRGLRETNEVSNKRYFMFLRVIIALSFLVQLASLTDRSNGNPLLVIFPPAPSGKLPSIPFPKLMTLLLLLVHINLAFLVFPDDLWRLQFGDTHIRPFSYQFLYAMAAVAPTISLFLQRPWQSTVWWSLTIAVIFIVETAISSIEQGDSSISDLETMKYTAPGA